MIPLAFLPDGAKGIVRGIAGGYGVRRRLYELGFVEGTEVIVVRNMGAGPLIVSVYGSRLALGRGVAMKVLVEVGS
ncbi:MAG: hypothetical protein DRJ38_01330 [Thermoprotei archaeon]|nr:MAG: hypothetical protein DRJ38_01330 [Thermoprotei archaeon]